MNLAHPKVFWMAIVLLPLLALFFWATWRKRQSLIRQFVQHKTLTELSLRISTQRQILKRIVLFVAVVLLLLAIAGPQWGFTWEEASQRGRDIIVAIDTSRSMLATDVQPDRLTRAKLAALDLLKLGKFDRFGLIAFAGSAFLQCPLTFDDEAFRQSVQILEPGIIPQGGTALSEAIRAARDAYGKDAEENHKILILFTDGEDHEEQVMETVERAAADGIRIFTVGVGTPAGELLRVRDERGGLVYVKDDSGNVVKSRLNEQLLQQIATAAKGFYIPLQGGNAMDVLYQRGIAPLPTTERSSKLMKRLKEQFYWPLSAAILLLLLEVFLPDEKRNRKRAGALTAAPQAAVAGNAVALFIACLTLASARAGAAKAERHYKAGEYKSALSAYQELLGKNPADPRLHYNAGAAAYQAKKFDDAQREFQAAVASPDLDLQQQAFYNLGNADFRVGEANSNPQERSAAWEQAIQHYDAALKINPKDADAEYNRELVKKKLEELKKQQQDQKQQDKNQQQDNKDQNQDQQNKEQKDNKSDQDHKSDQPKDNQDKQGQDQQQKQNAQQQQSKEDQQKKQQEQAKSGERKKEDKQNEQAQAKPGGEKNSDQDKEDAEAASAAQFAQLGKMSPEQAKQLLDAQRSEEKALLFIPPDRRENSRARTFKDW